MNDEAMTASNENQGLYAELSRREDLSRNMISEQQASYEEVQRITIEHEVMITAADYYENIISTLSKVVKKQERCVADCFIKLLLCLMSYLRIHFTAKKKN
jgi:putative IMPACT (imprinted ancient) family translation regulator